MEKVNIEFPLKNPAKLTEQDAVKVMMAGIKKLVEFGALKGDPDQFLLDYKFADKQGYAVAEVDKTALVDPSKLQSIGASLTFPVDVTLDEVKLEDKKFSVTTIQERMRLMGMNPKIRFRQTILDFKKYWKLNIHKMKKEPVLAKRLKNMFLTEMTGIFTEILPYVQEGKQLATLTGLTSMTDGMQDVARDLSMAYRKALKQSKTGQLSKSIFTSLQGNYSQFMNTLIPQVFPGIEEVLGQVQEQPSNKSFSKTEGVVTVTTTSPEQLHKILSYIDKCAKGGHCTEIVVDKGGDGEKSFNWDGDGNDRIISIEMSSHTTKNYSYTSEGRIKLFE